MRYLTVINLVVFYIFAYGVTRYAAPRYECFILSLVTFQVIVAFCMIFDGVFMARLSKHLSRCLVVLLCCVSIIPLALPVFRQHGAMIGVPRYEQVHKNGYGHDIAHSYALVRAQIGDKEPLLTIDFRSYYWQNSSQQVIELPKQDRLSLEGFQNLVKSHPVAWIVIPKGKMHYLKTGVQKYLQEHAADMSIPGTHVFIYKLVNASQ